MEPRVRRDRDNDPVYPIDYHGDDGLHVRSKEIIVMARTWTGRWSKRAWRAAKAAGLLASGTAAASLGLAYFVAHTLTAPRRPSPLDDYVVTPFETGVTFEEVTFPS